MFPIIWMVFMGLIILMTIVAFVSSGLRKRYGWVIWLGILIVWNVSTLTGLLVGKVS